MILKLLRVVLVVSMILLAFYMGRSSVEKPIIQEQYDNLQQQDCFIEGAKFAQAQHRAELKQWFNELEAEFLELGIDVDFGTTMDTMDNE
jgi:hypothetical protein